MKLAILLCTAALGLSAANASDDPLDLNKAIALLKAQNLEIKAADFDIDSARERTAQASGNPGSGEEFVEEAPAQPNGTVQAAVLEERVITSYSIHYTKLYERTIRREMSI